jgi:hypothetical protein
MKLNEKFYLWRNKLTPKQRENIKTGINLLIGALLVFGFYNVYNAGVHNGQVSLCKEQNGVLVEFQGVKECWTIDSYNAYIEQWEQSEKIGGGLNNELQYNIS